ncbi:hypothetical protein CC2G_011248 [Coprinopsis cinerea AmutBmut pab1-1]|nr:hypothetical protein CC2G_011248 [Coprinopsis cinerea AmutBmut pab1-1]
MPSSRTTSISDTSASSTRSIQWFDELSLSREPECDEELPPSGSSSSTSSCEDNNTSSTRKSSNDSTTGTFRPREPAPSPLVRKRSKSTSSDGKIAVSLVNLGLSTKGGLVSLSEKRQGARQRHYSTSEAAAISLVLRRPYGGRPTLQLSRAGTIDDGASMDEELAEASWVVL